MKFTKSMVWKEAAKITMGRKFHKEDLQDESVKAGAVLIGAFVVGPNINKIAKFIDLPRLEVQKFGRIARKNEIWVGSKINAQEYFDKESGGVAFCCDVNVLLGYLKKVRS